MSDNEAIDSSIILAILLAIALFAYWRLYTYGNLPSSGDGSKLGDKFLKVLLAPLVNIVPIGIFTSGIISDLIHGEVRLGIPAYGSLLLLILLSTISRFMQTGMPPFTEGLTSDSADFWCTLPGLEFLENMWFPSSILTSMSIALYYFWWNVNSPGSTTYKFGGALVAVVLATNLIGFKMGNCSPYYRPLFQAGGGWFVLFQTYLLALVFSGLMWTVVKLAYPSKNPLINLQGSSSGNTNDSGSGSGSGSGGGWGGYGLGCPPGQQKTEKRFCIVCDPATSIVVGENCVPDDSKKSLSNQSGVVQNGEQTFVAELYKNGQLVTESISK